MRRTYQQTIPFLISLVGVLADYITTTFGLQIGFVETHAQYHPMIALTIFWGSLLLLTFTSPRNRTWELGKNIFASTAFLGATNNLLIINGRI
jgi:hypothetical protein